MCISNVSVCDLITVSDTGMARYFNTPTPPEYTSAE